MRQSVGVPWSQKHLWRVSLLARSHSVSMLNLHLHMWGSGASVPDGPSVPNWARGQPLSCVPLLISCRSARGGSPLQEISPRIQQPSSSLAQNWDESKQRHQQQSSSDASTFSSTETFCSFSWTWGFSHQQTEWKINCCASWRDSTGFWFQCFRALQPSHMSISEDQQVFMSWQTRLGIKIRFYNNSSTWSRQLFTGQIIFSWNKRCIVLKLCFSDLSRVNPLHKHINKGSLAMSSHLPLPVNCLLINTDFNDPNWKLIVIEE